METYRKIFHFFFFFFFFFSCHHLAVVVTGDSNYPLVESNLFLACGWLGNTSTPDQTWVGDVNSQYSPHEDASAPKSTTVTENKQVPYSKSRVSHSQFTYIFNVTAGQKFIRLHFYPSSKPEFNTSAAFFSVKAASFTLLRNFSASLAAAAYGNDRSPFFKEFCINIEDDQRLLNITFTPSPDYNELYAFINGIEIVSMPLNFYYTAADDPGRGSDLVYETARTMGQDREINEKYNLTWEFEVDSGFTYFLRLHFCEFQIEVTEDGDRVFQIFIANLTAEVQADVIAWTGANGVTVYRDYAVMIGSKPNEENIKQNLSIQLHPAPRWRTKYSDAILNGLEIFKVDNTGNLGGPNPEPRTIPPNLDASPTIEPTKKNNVTGMVAGAISGSSVLSLLLLLIFWRGRKVKDSSSGTGTSLLGTFLWSKTIKATKSSRGSFLPSDLCTQFSLSEIQAATNNFDNDLVIGVGGFGDVYKGFINGSTTPVAIKRLEPESQQGALEFQTEIGMLSQLRHLHLVSLIGFCNDDREMILVYDFMARGTLPDHLYHSDNPPLPWNQRLEICIGAARGLHYLHTGANHAVIIHRDVKTTNILLDEKWVAKVSDFGLSKFGPTSVSKTHLTEKSDVYSFGVVLFEVLCARPSILRTAAKKQVSLAVWAQQCYQNGTIDQIVDPFLKGIRRPSMSDVVWGLEFSLQLQESSIAIAKEIDENEEEEKLLDNYETDGSGPVFSSVGEHVLSDSKTISTVTISTTTATDDQSLSTGSSDKYTGAVFSEILNPKGR
ncbi:Receptor-like protein kinase FERONIA [Citrus sinensis]|uniref:Receptor-like protein kinase FERONIA n=1 Tax=Citrus sinensis TaxID=2711 RepID=A0ACB8M2C0_CITSI|nr:Receptor-like protein kinase FERONIA [Citrus sinensis]